MENNPDELLDDEGLYNKEVKEIERQTPQTLFQRRGVDGNAIYSG